MEFKEVGTKNIRYIWSVLCNSSMLDSETQNLTINNIVEQITISIPKEMVERKGAEKSNGYVVPAPLHIVTRVKKILQNQDVSFDIKFEEINPEGKTLNSTSSARFDIKKPFKTFRVRTNYTPLLIDKSGEYTIRVLLKESTESDFIEVDRIPLEVNVAEATKFNGNI